MSGKQGEVRQILAAVDRSLAELREYHTGPSFKIVHRFQSALLDCGPGEEVWLICLVHRGREFPLPLSLSLLLFFDYLARTRHVPQLASQIVAGLEGSEFYRRHGANAGVVQKRRFSRSTVKEYVKRTRQALASVITEADLPIMPDDVLRTECTVANESRYRLKAHVEWVHLRCATSQL